MNLFDKPGDPLASADQSLEDYLATAPLARRKLTELDVPGWNLNDMLKKDSGVLMTYRGYLRFLVSDLEDSSLLKSVDGSPLSKAGSEKVRKGIARKMLECGSVRESPYSYRLARSIFPLAFLIPCREPLPERCAPQLPFAQAVRSQVWYSTVSWSRHERLAGKGSVTFAMLFH